MITLGHRLAFGWGFFFAVFCVLIGLEGNGFHIQSGVMTIVVIANFTLMIAAWFRCGYEKRVLGSGQPI